MAGRPLTRARKLAARFGLPLPASRDAARDILRRLHLLEQLDLPDQDPERAELLFKTYWLQRASQDQKPHPEQFGYAAELIRLGVPIEDQRDGTPGAARRAGMHPSTLRHWMANDPSVGKAVAEARRDSADRFLDRAAECAEIALDDPKRVDAAATAARIWHRQAALRDPERYGEQRPAKQQVGPGITFNIGLLGQMQAQGSGSAVGEGEGAGRVIEGEASRERLVAPGAAGGTGGTAEATAGEVRQQLEQAWAAVQTMRQRTPEELRELRPAVPATGQLSVELDRALREGTATVQGMQETVGRGRQGKRRAPTG